MKNLKAETQKTKNKKNSPAGKSDQNTLKTPATAASVNNVITSAVGRVKATSGRGSANEGTTVSYEHER